MNAVYYFLKRKEEVFKVNQLIATTSLMTPVLTWAITQAISKTPLNNRWLPLLSLLIGLLTGLFVGYFVDPAHLMMNVTLGAFGGANATWLDQFIKQTLQGGTNE